MLAGIYDLNDFQEKPIKYTKKVCVFGEDDFVMCTDESGKLLSSGYSIESKFINDGNIMPPLAQLVNNNNNNTNDSESDEFSSIYKNLAIPAGLSYINYPRMKGHEPELAEASDRYTFKEPLSDDVFDRLFELIQGPSSSRKTNKRTRKQGPMTLVGLEGGKKPKKHSRKNKNK
jgi:hypothetical protein